VDAFGVQSAKNTRADFQQQLYRALLSWGGMYLCLLFIAGLMLLVLAQICCQIKYCKSQYTYIVLFSLNFVLNNKKLKLIKVHTKPKFFKKFFRPTFLRVLHI